MSDRVELNEIADYNVCSIVCYTVERFILLIFIHAAFAYRLYAFLNTVCIKHILQKKNQNIKSPYITVVYNAEHLP